MKMKKRNRGQSVMNKYLTFVNWYYGKNNKRKKSVYNREGDNYKNKEFPNEKIKIIDSFAFKSKSAVPVRIVNIAKL